jgi:hypothetical protein
LPFSCSNAIELSRFAGGARLSSENLRGGLPFAHCFCKGWGRFWLASFSDGCRFLTLPSPRSNATHFHSNRLLYSSLFIESSKEYDGLRGQSFSYDAFGNVSKQVLSGSAGTSFQPTYATSPSITNQIATLPGNVHPTYDANGNSLNDSFSTYAWDADNNAVLSCPLAPRTESYDV